MEFTQVPGPECGVERGSGAGARSPGPGVGGRREVLVRAGAGGGGACAASPWRADRGATLGVRASPSPRPGQDLRPPLEENPHGLL